MEDSSSSGVKLPQFDGEEENYPIWITRFEAYARLKRFEQALSDSVDLPTNQEEYDEMAAKASPTDEEKKKIRNAKANETAVAQLTMAFQTTDLLTFVKESKSKEWQHGLAWKIIKNLADEYEPKDEVSKVELKRDLNNVTMQEDDDPKELFSQLTTIERKYASSSYEIPKEDLMAVALEAAPEKYAVILAKELRDKGDACALSDLKEAMKAQYRLATKGKKNKSNGKELSLSTFTGTCFECGEAGHKANECPNKKQHGNNGGRGYRSYNRGRGKFKGKCNNCGKIGHKAADCWLLEKNKDKRPKNFSEKGLSNVNDKEDGKTSELLLMNLCQECNDDITVEDSIDEESYVNIENEKIEIDTVNLSDEDASYMEVCKCDEVSLVKKDEEEQTTFSTNASILDDPNCFIADTGATSDSSPHDLGMVNIKPGKIEDATSDASGKMIRASKTADLHGTICDKNGQAVCKGVIKGIAHLPRSRYNLFSISRRLDDGWKLGGDQDMIKLVKGNDEIKFDIKIKTKKGAVYCMYFKRHSEISATTKDAPQKISLQKAHDLFGHMATDTMRKAAAALGYEITRGGMKPCAACAIAKAKQKKIARNDEEVLKVMKKENTVTDRKGKVPNELVKIDATKITPPQRFKEITVAKPNWVMIVDTFTGMKVTRFYQTKAGMVEPTCIIFQQWKDSNKPVQRVRCDNAGENITLEARAKSADWKLNIEFEFTARDTPQQNSEVEVGLLTIAGRGRAMMIGANVPHKSRYKFFREAFTCATLLDGLTVIELNGKEETRYIHWQGNNPAWTRSLRTWGEAGVVKLKTKFTPKLANRGEICMFVGYAPAHSEAVYRMWDPNSNRVHVTRDVIWLNRMYFQVKEEEEEIITRDEQVDAMEVRESKSATSDGDGKAVTFADTVITTSTSSTPPLDHEAEEEIIDEDEAAEIIDKSDTNYVTRSGREVRPSSRYTGKDYAVLMLTQAEQDAHDRVQAFEAADIDKEQIQGELACVELAAVGAGLGGGFEHTSELKVLKFKQAMKTKDRVEWLKAVEEEHKKMEKYKVWTPVKLSKVPKGAKVLSTTWAMKKKANGVFRARLNARGFEQVEGMHYDASSISSPVATDVSIRIAMILGLMARWESELVDVKGAFLNGSLGDGDQIYMEVPEGFEKYYPDEDTVLMLLKAIYGTKQAAIQFWKELLKCQRDMKNERNAADPCVYFKWTAEGLIMWLSWIDDCMVWGPKEQMLIEKQEFMRRFDCDDVGPLEEYVGCKIERNREEHSIKFTQPVLLQSFTDEYDIEGREYATPADPNTVLVKAVHEAIVNKTRQTYYRSGVGKLLHMTRWSRPETQNAVRELSRHGSAPSEAHVKAMHRCMNYCVNTPNRGWYMRPNRSWDGKDKKFLFKVSGMSDSDYAKCPVTRRSVSGYSTMLEGAPVTVKSSMQKVVALSVTEAETIAAVQCAQDMLHIMRIMEAMELNVERPMILHVDNSGAVDLINSWASGGRTRHMDTRLNFLRELKEDGILKVVWTSSMNNPSDLFTKNLPGPLFRKHVTTYCGNDEYGTNVEKGE